MNRELLIIFAVYYFTKYGVIDDILRTIGELIRLIYLFGKHIIYKIQSNQLNKPLVEMESILKETIEKRIQIKETINKLDVTRRNLN